jgi:integrase
MAGAPGFEPEYAGLPFNSITCLNSGSFFEATATAGCYGCGVDAVLGHYTNIHRRGSTYYLRVAVPKDLQAPLGKVEVWKSLRTNDEKQARHTATSVLAALQADWEFERLRLLSDLGASEQLSDQAIFDIAAEFYEFEKTADETARLHVPTQSELEEIRERSRQESQRVDLNSLEGNDLEMAALALSLDYIVAKNAAKNERDRHRLLLAEVRRHLRDGETVLVQWAANEALRKRKLVVSPRSLDYRRLCLALLRTWIEVLERTVERDQGDWKGRPADELVLSALKSAPVTTTPSSPAASSSETVEALFERYARENPRNVKSDTLEQSRKIISLFAESLPSTTFQASKITKKEVREWKALLQQYPVKAAEIRELKGKSIAAVVELNKALGKPTISPKSINKYLSALGAFCTWLVNHGYLDVNPVDGLQVKYDRERSPVRPYSNEQLSKIFSSPLYLGCKSENEWHIKGSVHFDDHRYWLPLLALFSGARLGELAQLQTNNIFQSHGHWAMHITREGGKETKTKGSQRVVPIHDALARLGFLKFVDRCRTAGGRALFPLLTVNSRGQIAGDYSRAYGRFLLKIEIKAGNELNFHSFRHTFTDALRRAGYLDENFGFLLGHTQATTTGRYGVLSEGALDDRLKLVAAVSYPGVHLPRSAYDEDGS